MPKSDTQFRPGQSGNPLGRPKGPSLAKAIMTLLELPPAELQKPRPGDRVVDRVAQSLVIAALTGEASAVTAIRTILERTDGAVPQQVSVTDTRSPLEVFEARVNGSGRPAGILNGGSR